jgi:hypothetical protein
MATVKKIKKAQSGKNVPKGMVESEMHPGKMIPKSQSNYYNGEYAKMLEAGRPKASAKKVAPKKKMKEGGKVAAGVGGKSPKAGLIDPKGAWTKVQERTIGKARDGKSFPDLNKDGKVTKADILKGRGVIARKGAKVAKSSGMAKCKYGCK